MSEQHHHSYQNEERSPSNRSDQKKTKMLKIELMSTPRHENDARFVSAEPSSVSQVNNSEYTATMAQIPEEEKSNYEEQEPVSTSYQPISPH